MQQPRLNIFIYCVLVDITKCFQLIFLHLSFSTYFSNVIFSLFDPSFAATALMGNDNTQPPAANQIIPAGDQSAKSESGDEVSAVFQGDTGQGAPGQEELPVQMEEKVENIFVPQKKRYKSKVRQCALDESKLVVSNPLVKKQFGLDSQIMLVPFSVILQKMDHDLHHTFISLASEMFSDYLEKDKYDKQWKLHGNGFFINYQEGYFICIITPKMIYKGAAGTDKHNTIYPTAEGTLITKEGLYHGGFKRGKAFGNGTYVNKVTGISYVGEWEDGVMVEGRIEGEQYKFKGHLEQGMAEGQGSIQFKKTLSTYKGTFHQGKYHGKDGIYKTKNYLYEGEFANGMKQGDGTLAERPKGKIPKKSKYRPAQIFDGQWIEDYYVTTRADREKMKIRGEENRQILAHMFDQVMYFGQNNEGKISEFDQLYNQPKNEKNDKNKNQNDGGFMAGIRQINRKSKNQQKMVETVPTDPEIPDYIEEQALGSNY